MTRRSRMAIASSALLALVVIASSVFWAYGRNGGEAPADGAVLVAAIALVSVASVVLVYLLRARRSAAEKLLDGAFYEKYEHIREIISGSQLTGRLKADLSEEVLDMLVTAQRAGRAPEDVIGDARSFAEDVIGSFARPSRLALLGLFDGGVAFCLFVLGITSLNWLEDTKAAFFSTRMDLAMLVFVAWVSFLVIPATKALTKARIPWAYVLPLASGAAFVLAMEAARRYLYSVGAIRAFIDGEIVPVPGMAALLCYMAAVPLLLAAKRLLGTRLVRRS
ncbi:MAG TPA: hypothetical protein PKK63_00030 [Bacillota bacterium]|nr:hypothetical protein [Bacillota bacterium]